MQSPEELFEECRLQFLIGRPLTESQRRRLHWHGYSVKDFREECFRWRDKHLTMLTQDVQIMGYIPTKLWLSIHDARYDYQTELYWVTYRTQYFPAQGEFRYRYASFRRLTDIHQFFMEILKKNTREAAEGFYGKY